MTTALNSYHFDLGNSTIGPIGFCARVRAASPEKAVALLRAFLPEELAVDGGGDGVEYVQVYFNDAAVTAADIDTVDDEDVDRSPNAG